MEFTSPRVYMIAATQVLPEMEEWMQQEFGDDAFGLLLSRTGYATDPETLIEFAARRCYRSFAPMLNRNVTKIRTEHSEYLDNIVKQEHGSVTAHATVTFAIEGCSRVFTHELVRNAIGNAFSQESMRYVRMDSFTMRLPKILEPFAWRLTQAMRSLEDSLHIVREQAEAEAEAGEKAKTDFAWKKAFTSALRHFMPQVTTGIVVTFNLRSLRWLCAQRTEPGADEEMREIAFMVYQKAVAIFPNLLKAELVEDDLSYSGTRTQVKFANKKI